MRYRSNFTLRENFEEIRSSSDDLETHVNAVSRQLRDFRTKLRELEKLLERTIADPSEAYDDATKGLVIVRELIDETD